MTNKYQRQRIHLWGADKPTSSVGQVSTIIQTTTTDTSAFETRQDQIEENMSNISKLFSTVMKDVLDKGITHDEKLARFEVQTNEKVEKLTNNVVDQVDKAKLVLHNNVSNLENKVSTLQDNVNLLKSGSNETVDNLKVKLEDQFSQLKQTTNTIDDLAQKVQANSNLLKSLPTTQDLIDPELINKLNKFELDMIKVLETSDDFAKLSSQVEILKKVPKIIDPELIDRVDKIETKVGNIQQATNASLEKFSSISNEVETLKKAPVLTDVEKQDLVNKVTQIQQNMNTFQQAKDILTSDVEILKKKPKIEPELIKTIDQLQLDMNAFQQTKTDLDIITGVVQVLEKKAKIVPLVPQEFINRVTQIESKVGKIQQNKDNIDILTSDVDILKKKPKVEPSEELTKQINQIVSDMNTFQQAQDDLTINVETLKKTPKVEPIPPEFINRVTHIESKLINIDRNRYDVDILNKQVEILNKPKPIIIPPEFGKQINQILLDMNTFQQAKDSLTADVETLKNKPKVEPISPELVKKINQIVLDMNTFQQAQDDLNTYVETLKNKPKVEPELTKKITQFELDMNAFQETKDFLTTHVETLKKTPKIVEKDQVLTNKVKDIEANLNNHLETMKITPVPQTFVNRVNLIETDINNIKVETIDRFVKINKEVTGQIDHLETLKVNYIKMGDNVQSVKGNLEDLTNKFNKEDKLEKLQVVALTNLTNAVNVEKESVAKKFTDIATNANSHKLLINNSLTNINELRSDLIKVQNDSKLFANNKAVVQLHATINTINQKISDNIFSIDGNLSKINQLRKELDVLKITPSPPVVIPPEVGKKIKLIEDDVDFLKKAQQTALGSGSFNNLLKTNFEFQELSQDVIDLKENLDTFTNDLKINILPNIREEFKKYFNDYFHENTHFVTLSTNVSKIVNALKQDVTVLQFFSYEKLIINEYITLQLGTHTYLMPFNCKIIGATVYKPEDVRHAIMIFTEHGQHYIIASSGDRTSIEYFKLNSSMKKGNKLFFKSLVNYTPEPNKPSFYAEVYIQTMPEVV